MGGWTGGGGGVEGAVGEIGCFCLPLMYVSTVFYFYFPWFGHFFSLSVSVSVSVSLSPSLSHMKREVGRYVSEESNYNN